MINLNLNPRLDQTIAKNNNQLNEWKLANANIKPNFYVSCSIVANKHINTDMKFLMFPYSNKDMITNFNDDIFMINHIPLYAERDIKECSKKSQCVKLNLNEITEPYNCLDIYFINEANEMFDKCRLSCFVFDENKYDNLFAYEKTIYEESYGAKIVTIAKIESDIWKIYPIFEKVELKSHEVFYERFVQRY